MEPLTRHGDGDSDEGFTLIEILVSFAILVAAVAVLQAGFGGGWRGVRYANLEAEALEIARAKLAAAGIEAPLEAGVSEGDAGAGFFWRVVIEPHAGQGVEETSHRGFWTTAEVRWSDGRSKDARQISLTTLKIKQQDRPAK